MNRYNLYLALKNAGYPQGGSGGYIQHPDTNDKVYVPLPSELYNHFTSDPKEWEDVVDALAKVWIDKCK